MTILGHEITIKTYENDNLIDFENIDSSLKDTIIMSINDSILEGSTASYGEIEEYSIYFEWEIEEYIPSFDELKNLISSFEGKLDVSQINQLSDEIEKLHKKRIELKCEEIFNEYILKSNNNLLQLLIKYFNLKQLVLLMQKKIVLGLMWLN